MCTAMSLTTDDHYFGRNLDLDRSFGEEVCVMPRKFPFPFGRMGNRCAQYAMIGMATVVDGIPLYYDAVNECGLAMAGLNFPGNAYYVPRTDGETESEKDNIAPYAFIPWILGQCKTVREAKERLSRMNLADIAFREEIPPSPRHWMISDGTEDIVVESVRNGLHVHENPVGVLTNNPPFPYQLANLEQYRNLRCDNSGIAPEPENTAYSAYCQGLGAVGLPGDVSSMSRFVRAAFGRNHSVCDGDEDASVSQFFHLLSSVEMVKGVCKTDAGTWDITVYSACMNTTKGLYYYTTYDNRSIMRVDLYDTDPDAATLSRYPLQTTL